MSNQLHPNFHYNVMPESTETQLRRALQTNIDELATANELLRARDHCPPIRVRTVDCKIEIAIQIHGLWIPVLTGEGVVTAQEIQAAIRFHLGITYMSTEKRQLTDHIVSGDQAVQLKIAVVDEPGPGGANHAYVIDWYPEGGDPSPSESRKECFIHFQEGPIKEAGVNGITQEALLAIVIDRLRSFQSGQFSCRENAIALTHCEEALMWLQRRTVARIKRGVEGTNQK